MLILVYALSTGLKKVNVFHLAGECDVKSSLLFISSMPCSSESVSSTS